MGGGQSVLSDGGEDMADEGMGVAMRELLILFKSRRWARRIPPPSPFVGLRYAPASSRAGRGDDRSGGPPGSKVSWFANYRICPALLTPRQRTRAAGNVLILILLLISAIERSRLRLRARLGRYPAGRGRHSRAPCDNYGMHRRRCWSGCLD